MAMKTEECYIIGIDGGTESIRHGAQKMVRIQDRILPDRKNYETYQFFVGRYIETYDRLSESMHKMAAEKIQI